MKILTNLNDEQSHINELCDCLKTSQKAYISVAFLKMSGLTLIMDALNTFLSNNGEIHIIAGQNFALTEPGALEKIYNLLKTHSKSKLYIYKAESTDNIFHPKMYLFESNKSGKIIFGSANMTKGGLLCNNEISISLECKLDSEIWKQSITTFNTYISNAIPASLISIAQYNIFYEKQKNYNKNVKAIPPIHEYAFDYNELSKYLKKISQKELEQMFSERNKSYRKATKILNEIADDPHLTKKKFIPLLDNLVISGIWHSGSLYRQKTSIYKYYKEFAQLIHFIRTNKLKSPDYVFSNAMKLAKNIKGVSVNYVTEIMISYNPQDFAILNRNSFTVLSEKAGINFKYKNPRSFNGEEYTYFCELIKEISEKLGFSNMLEADSFFNDIYWNIKYD